MNSEVLGGFLSRIRYHDYYISYRELDESLSYTPALSDVLIQQLYHLIFHLVGQTVNKLYK